MSEQSQAATDSKQARAATGPTNHISQESPDNNDDAVGDGAEEDERSRADDSNTHLEGFYGAGKLYPEPYLAGKMPLQFIKERTQHQIRGEVYTYSVRFRAGPLGLSFDNRVSSFTTRT